MSVAAESAYNLIRSRILDGSFEAGKRLKEGELSNECQVSRTPVREALRRLAADGLVDITPNSGAVVTRWSKSDVFELYTLRHHLEALAASWAAERRTDEQLERMKTLADAHSKLVNEGGGPDYEAKVSRLNHEFHHLIIEAAGSRALSAAVSHVIEAPLMFRNFARYDHARMLRSASDHQHLVKAIEARDGELASTIMKAHILAGLRTIVEDVNSSTAAKD